MHLGKGVGRCLRVASVAGILLHAAHANAQTPSPSPARVAHVRFTSASSGASAYSVDRSARRRAGYVLGLTTLATGALFTFFGLNALDINGEQMRPDYVVAAVGISVAIIGVTAGTVLVATSPDPAYAPGMPLQRVSGSRPLGLSLRGAF